VTLETEALLISRHAALGGELIRWAIARADAIGGSSPPPCGEGSGVGVGRDGEDRAPRHAPPPQPSPNRNRVYAGFGHSIKQSKSATADFDRGEEVTVARPQLMGWRPAMPVTQWTWIKP